MTSEECKINQIVAEVLHMNYIQEVKQFVPEAELINDLGADSLDLMEIQIEIENNFNIEIFEIPYHITLQDLYQLAA